MVYVTALQLLQLRLQHNLYLRYKNTLLQVGEHIEFDEYGKYLWGHDVTTTANFIRSLETFIKRSP